MNKLQENSTENVNLLVNLYNKLTGGFQDILFEKAQGLQGSLLALLATFAVLSLTFIVIRSWKTGEPLGSSLLEKLGLFIFLSLLLRTSFFKANVSDYAIALFNKLPGMFSNNDSSNVIQSLITQVGQTVDAIFRGVSTLSWGMAIPSYIFATLATLVLYALLLVVFLNVLRFTFIFYMTLGFSGIVLLLMFFKTTRSYGMNAINMLFACILNMTILSFFVAIIGKAFVALISVKNGDGFIQSCLGIAVISALSIYLIGNLKEIAQTITSHGISTGGQAAGAAFRSISRRFSK